MSKFDKDNSEETSKIIKDVVFNLLNIFNEKDLTLEKNSINEQLVKLTVKNLVSLQRYFPEISEELKCIAKDFHDGLKETVITKLFENN